MVSTDTRWGWPHLLVMGKVLTLCAEMREGCCVHAEIQAPRGVCVNTVELEEDACLLGGEETSSSTAWFICPLPPRGGLSACDGHARGRPGSPLGLCSWDSGWGPQFFCDIRAGWRSDCLNVFFSLFCCHFPGFFLERVVILCSLFLPASTGVPAEAPAT